MVNVRPVEKVGGDEHNEIDSRTGCVGYANWTETARR